MLGTIAQAVALSGVLWFLWKYCKQAVLTSPLDNIPGPPRDSFLYGNLKQILHRHAWPVYDALTEAYPGVLRLAGPLGHRILYVFDPVALHSIIVKDQYVFEESRFFIKTSEVTLGPGLLATLGDHHRKQRKLLNPVFSIAHMRHMLPTFYDISHKLQQGIEGRVSGRSGPVEVDILSWMGRVALELIGQSGLGYSFDPLVADSADELGLAVKSFQPLMMQLNIFRRILPYLPDVGSPWLRRKIVEMIPNKNVQMLKKNVDLMHERAVAICEEKKRLLAQGDEAFKDKVGEGKDLMSILLRANMAASDEDKLPDEEIVGQVSTFIVAAMDTTSNALSMTFSLLAEHPEVQEKLRKEIMRASSGGLEDIDYDALVSLPYLDAVCRETLRMHPPITSVFRETRKDAVLPLSQPITGVDGSQVSEILVPKDTTVIVGIYSSNRNKAIWGEDAFEWKPERWLNGLPDTVADAKIPGVYSNLMTFLGGGRACIGFKFSQLEMKVVLCLMLLKFKFEPSGKQIKWNIAGIRFPSVGDSTKPSLPLKLSMYKESRAARTLSLSQTTARSLSQVSTRHLPHTLFNMIVPLDVILHIFDLLSGDDSSTGTLYNCALTGQELHIYARASLYRSITLAEVPALAKARKLSRTLNANPPLGALVRTLTLCHITLGEGNALGSGRSSRPRLAGLLPWHLLCELRGLTLDLVRLKTCDSLVAVISVLPRLKMLNYRHWWHRSRLPWPLPLTFTESPDPVLDIDPPDSARFPTIKAIAIYYKAWTHLTLVERLLQDDGWAARALQVIDLAFAYGSAWTLLWVPVIHAAAAQLRSITIPMPGRALTNPDEPRWAFALAEQHPNFHAYVLENVAHCSALRFLHLRHEPDVDERTPSSDGFFERVCELFELVPEPFPAFEHLKLTLVNRDRQMCSVTDALCARLAGSLLDRRRYPTFRMLTIRVQPQTWSVHLGLPSRWQSLYSDSKIDLGDGLVESCRAAFCHFDWDRDVVLDVDEIRRDS